MSVGQREEIVRKFPNFCEYYLEGKKKTFWENQWNIWEKKKQEKGGQGGNKEGKGGKGGCKKGKGGQGVCKEGNGGKGGSTFFLFLFFFLFHFFFIFDLIFFFF